MIASLLAPRDELYGALGAAGLSIAESAGLRVAVPGVIVAPADPWIISGGVLVVTVRRSAWGVRAVSGRSDAAGALDDLDAYLRAVWGALAPLFSGGGWTVPEISAPVVYPVNGADHVTALVGPMHRLISMANTEG